MQRKESLYYGENNSWIAKDKELRMYKDHKEPRELTHNLALQQAYSHLWEEARDEFVQGDVLTDPEPGHRSGSTRWGVALIMRPEPAVGQRLAECISQFRPLIGEQHIFYDASNLHTTIRVYEYYRGSVDMEDPEIRRYVEITQEVARQYAPFEIAFQGITASLRGILAQGYPLTDVITHFRRQLHDHLAEAGLGHGPEQYVGRNIFHSSLCVFNGPLLHPEEAAAFVDQERTRDFGITTATTLELVRYHRTAYTVTPVHLASITLASNAGQE